MASYSLVGYKLFNLKLQVEEMAELFELSKDRILSRLPQLAKGNYCPSAMSVRDGRTKLPEYYVWREIKERCNNPKNKEYHNYGGRGIKMYEFWQCPYFGFWLFLDSVGPRPSDEHSIDRINSDRGYSPNNLKWSLPSEQAANKRNNRKYKGKTMAEWSRISGLNYSTLVWRHKNNKELGLGPCLDSNDYS